MVFGPDGALYVSNWGAADDNFSWTSVQRVELFRDFAQKMTLPGLVSVMNRAATEDLRAVDVWPDIRDVKRIRVKGTKAQAQLLAGWLRSRLI